MRVLIILSIALLATVSFTADVVSFDPCDGRWANEVMYEYTGPKCHKPPGCVGMCPKYCWKGQVKICNSGWGSILAAAASALARTGASINGGPADPKSLNQYLQKVHGYKNEVRINWNSLQPLGLRLEQETKDIQAIAQALSKKMIVVGQFKGSSGIIESIDTAAGTIQVSDVKQVGKEQPVPVNHLGTVWILQPIHQSSSSCYTLFVVDAFIVNGSI
eukprot:TRINITY_DN7375_c0_g1_i2.p1 TRINITY_DN7375_c0_g1~~TRINITY_DN7375_c0_g1_i2.p1  ORF type:complete len:218 (+),score=61.87 TRINITY_DN7375_c0_g1_i2:131-784(+)